MTVEKTMRKFYIANVVIALTLVVLTIVATGVLGIYILIAYDLPSITRIKDYNPSLVTTIYANDGQILGYLYREKRFLERMEAMPPYLPKAFLAAEDSSFYLHEGLDLSAIVRAFLMNMRSGEIVQGGSTITQQIIKQILLGSEKKLERKIKEAILAYQLENFLTKDEILTIYLNQVFFGAGAYGVEAAARTYFGKHVGDLTLAESAILAGLPKAPTTYNPLHTTGEARSRQKYVLSRMRELGWITGQEYQQALDEQLVYKSMPEPSWSLGAYYLEEVRRWLLDNLSKEAMRVRGVRLDRYGEDAVYESGLHVYTAVDLEHQEAAERAMREGLEEASKRRGWEGPVEHLRPVEFADYLDQNPVEYETLEKGDWVKAVVLAVEPKALAVRAGKYRGVVPFEGLDWTHRGSFRDMLKPGDVIWGSFVGPLRTRAMSTSTPVLTLALEQRPKVQGALASVEPKTGCLVALVGGYSFAESQFNRATQAKRQPGSSFKPIVYSAVLDAGYTPTRTVLDSPISFGNWAPKNYGGHYSGAMPLQLALAKSKNVVTVRLAAHIGVRRVIERARALGLEAQFPPFLPICLGAEALVPINLLQAYTAFARDGSYIKPRMVMSIANAWGEEIYRSEPEPVPAISHHNAYTMATMLKGAVEYGTGVRAKVLNRPVAGKTGTTNDERDAWFMGFSPYLATGIYVGYDNRMPMGRSEAGSMAALPIWVKYRLAVEDNYPYEDFAPPPDVKVAVRKPRYGFSSETPTTEARTPARESDAPEAAPSRKSAPPRSASTSEELLKQLF